MLGLQAEDLSHTRFYQDVLKQGITLSVVNFLVEKFGSLSPKLEDQVSALSSEELQALGKAIVHFEDVSELQAWLARVS
ncbi:DUF4351 domain-containing protein [Candidatus Synechococcus calcipolaris G9]|uniref:DUF4351 domain-containing protein n=2 Tax=Synechococcus TaxID=1129 RepID=A0ABT6EYW4_9SYNE|nr:DUF4351 domain-containing protein [Candidatus Synechococcus calcipolaris G9]